MSQWIVAPHKLVKRDDIPKLEQVRLKEDLEETGKIITLHNLKYSGLNGGVLERHNRNY